jgi:uncharacterized glyoxalase superfamily metalloenzyme YdcJ
VARDVWRENLSDTERELALQGLAFFTYSVATSLPNAGAVRSLRELVEAGVLVPEPIVYEDFLPRSAAGLFQSNLTDEGSRDDERLGTPYDVDLLSEGIRRPIAEPTLLYKGQAARLAGRCCRAAGPVRDHPRLNHDSPDPFPTLTI